MCHSRTSLDRARQQQLADDDRPMPEVAAGEPTARAGDADRDAVLSMLGDAAAEGYLQPAELDERMSAALTARTHGELHDLTVDLPPRWQERRVRAARATRARVTARAALRPQLAGYVAVMTLLVAIWLVVGLTAGAWYPWPVWPALGWGIALVGRIRAAGGLRPALAPSPAAVRAR